MLVFTQETSGFTRCDSVLSQGIHFVLDKVIPLGFEFQGQFLRAGAYDATVVEDMHKIRNNVVEQPLIVCNDQEGILAVAVLVHAIGHDAQGIDIQT